MAGHDGPLTATKVIVRAATSADVDAILSIYQPIVNETVFHSRNHLPIPLRPRSPLTRPSVCTSITLMTVNDYPSQLPAHRGVAARTREQPGQSVRNELVRIDPSGKQLLRGEQRAHRVILPAP